MRVRRMSEGTQDIRFPSFPIIHPSSSGASEIFPLESISTQQIWINPSSLDADANLVYLPSDEGRKTIDTKDDDIFTPNKGTLVDVSHTKEVSPCLRCEKESSLWLKEQAPTLKNSCLLNGSRTGLPLLASQNRTVPQRDADIINELSWEYFTEVIVSESPFHVRSKVPFGASQIRIVVSSDPDTILFPSGEQHIDLTSSECPSKGLRPVPRFPSPKLELCCQHPMRGAFRLARNKRCELLAVRLST